MLGKTALAFICISFSSFVFGKNSIPPSICGLIYSGGIHYKTYSPTNVNSIRNVITVPGTAFVAQPPIHSPIIPKNTGYNYEVRLDSNYNGTTNGRKTLCDIDYKFYKLAFYANPNFGTSFHTVNRKGTPLTASLIHFNSRYRNFDESLKHRDGLLIIDYMMNFSEEDNTSFYRFEERMKKDRKAGSSGNYPTELFTQWFNQVSSAHEYYAFLGSYMDPKSGNQNESAINILAKKVILALSEEQFINTFGSLRNQKGEIQNSTHPLNPPNEREVYKGPEIAKSLIYFSV